MGKLTIFLFIAACLTELDIKNAVCWSSCRKDGYDTGFFEKDTNSCICGRRVKFRDLTDKSIKVVPKKEQDERYD